MEEGERARLEKRAQRMFDRVGPSDLGMTKKI